MLIGYIDYKQLSFCKKDHRDRFCLDLDKGPEIDGKKWRNLTWVEDEFQRPWRNPMPTNGLFIFLCITLIGFPRLSLMTCCAQSNCRMVAKIFVQHWPNDYHFLL